MAQPFADVNNSQGQLFLADTIFNAIRLTPNVQTFESTVLWLQRSELTAKANTYQTEGIGDNARPTCGLPCQRQYAKTQSQIKVLRQQRAEFLLPIDREALWREHLDPTGAMLSLDVNCLPANAMAFYRSFHFEPFDEWGIYIYVDELWTYCQGLHESLSPNVHSFTLEILIGYVLFEIFHHEFFHHIVECAATTLEVLSPCFGSAKPLYLDYKQHLYENNELIGVHPHRPLEEALANAYAYNSMSFISRIKAGYKTTLVSLYQKMLERYWPTESAGYKEAGCYTGSSSNEGAAQLLAMLLNSGEIDCCAARLISRTVLLTGNSAFFAKPLIPTYLVGTPEILERFDELVPAPCETYTQLFWPGQTDDLDHFIQERKKAMSKKGEAQAKQ